MSRLRKSAVRCGSIHHAFDNAMPVAHSKQVLTLPHRLSAVMLSLVLLAGDAAVCAGWAPTPEARMACCADGAECPMHKGHSERTGAERVSQAQADACCASAQSDRNNSNQSSPTFASAISQAVLGAAVVVPVSAPLPAMGNAWRAVVPIPIAPAPKYVLLSVFLL
jgi:hypothetical protein